MKIIEAISRYKEERPASKLTTEQMIDRLSRIDSIIKHRVIDAHEGKSDAPFEGYDENVDKNTALLVPHPYDSLYISWLDCQSELLMGDYERYNIALSLFEKQLEDFEKHYKRTHMPIGGKFRYL